MWAKPQLMLIRMHPADIESIHSADLQLKYVTVGLDIFEIRSMFHSIPPSFGARDPEKRKWREALRERLETLTRAEAGEKLTSPQRRNACYAGATGPGPFDPAAPRVRQSLVRSAVGEPTERPVLGQNGVDFVARMASIQQALEPAAPTEEPRRAERPAPSSMITGITQTC